MRALFTTKENGKWYPLETGYTVEDTKAVLHIPLLRDGMAALSGYLIQSIWLEDTNEIWSMGSRSWEPSNTLQDFNTVWEKTLYE